MLTITKDELEKAVRKANNLYSKEEYPTIRELERRNLDPVQEPGMWKGEDKDRRSGRTYEVCIKCAVDILHSQRPHVQVVVYAMTKAAAEYAFNLVRRFITATEAATGVRAPAFMDMIYWSPGDHDRPYTSLRDGLFHLGDHTYWEAGQRRINDLERLIDNVRRAMQEAETLCVRR